MVTVTKDISMIPRLANTVSNPVSFSWANHVLSTNYVVRVGRGILQHVILILNPIGNIVNSYATRSWPIKTYNSVDQIPPNPRQRTDDVPAARYVIEIRILKHWKGRFPNWNLVYDLSIFTTLLAFFERHVVATSKLMRMYPAPTATNVPAASMQAQRIDKMQCSTINEFIQIPRTSFILHRVSGEEPAC
jgi:hypothetical protein